MTLVIGWIKDLLSRHPGMSVLLIVVILLILYVAGPFSCKLKDGFTCGFTNKGSYEEKKMYGYFNTLDEKEQTTCMEETLSLKFYDDDTIEGKSEAMVHKMNGEQEKRIWQHLGFIRPNLEISLSYRTKEIQTTATEVKTGAAVKTEPGTGVYYLMSQPPRKNYIGYWLGLDYPHGFLVQCPYVLTESQKEKNKTCKDKWPNVFDKSCMRLNKKFAISQIPS